MGYNVIAVWIRGFIPLTILSSAKTKLHRVLSLPFMHVSEWPTNSTAFRIALAGTGALIIAPLLTCFSKSAEDITILQLVVKLLIYIHLLLI